MLSVLQGMLEQPKKRFSVTTVITGIMLNVSARRNVNTPLLYLTPRRIGFAQYAFAPSPHTCLIWMMILIEVVLIFTKQIIQKYVRCEDLKSTT